MKMILRLFATILALTDIVACSGKDDNAPSSMTLTKSSVSVAPGESVQLNAVFLPAGSKADISWKSSFESIATVDAGGKVTGVSEGVTKVTASAGSLIASCTVTVTLTPDEDKRPGFSLRVMQFNVLQATGETEGHEWSTVRKEPCFSMLNELSPDIVCCEEARKSQCNDFATQFPGYAQVKHPKDDKEQNGGQRNLIMYKSSKFELLDWTKYWFSVDESPSGDRFCPSGMSNSDSKTTQKLTVQAHFREKAGGRDFYVFCTHFFADVDENTQRERCVELSLKHIKAIPADTPVFFCGDLNINYVSEDGRAMLKPMFDYMSSASVSAVSHDDPMTCTYNNFGASTKVLDYIFYRNANALSYKVVNSDIYGTRYLSDHYPVYSDFKVGK